MNPAPEETSFCAVAQVIPGGNRLLKITAHVVCLDGNGQERWVEDASVVIQIPCGDDMPQFTCSAVTTRVIEGPS